jgi:hypothetical protein
VYFILDLPLENGEMTGISLCIFCLVKETEIARQKTAQELSAVAVRVACM